MDNFTVGFWASTEDGFGGIACLMAVGKTFPQTFNVFEDSTASAELFGKIVGDPQLVLTGIELNPDQSSNGFIGHGVGSVPDSGGTLALVGIALAALAFFGISRKTAGTV